MVLERPDDQQQPVVTYAVVEIYQSAQDHNENEAAFLSNNYYSNDSIYLTQVSSKLLRNVPKRFQHNRCSINQNRA